MVQKKIVTSFAVKSEKKSIELVLFMACSLNETPHKCKTKLLDIVCNLNKARASSLFRRSGLSHRERT